MGSFKQKISWTLAGFGIYGLLLWDCFAQTEATQNLSRLIVVVLALIQVVIFAVYLMGYALIIWEIDSDKSTAKLFAEYVSEKKKLWAINTLFLLAGIVIVLMNAARGDYIVASGVLAAELSSYMSSCVAKAATKDYQKGVSF